MLQFLEWVAYIGGIISAIAWVCFVVMLVHNAISMPVPPSPQRKTYEALVNEGLGSQCLDANRSEEFDESMERIRRKKAK